MMIRKTFCWLFFVLVVSLGGALCLGQKSRPPLEPSNTDSPRETLTSFIAASNELNGLIKSQGSSADFATFLPAAERMRDCLDLSGLSPELRDSLGLESAVYLKEVLDRIALPSDEEIPGADPAEDSLNSRWRIPGTRLIIARVLEGPQTGSYLFSVETVRNASKFYSAAKQLPYRTSGPPVSEGFLERYAALTKRQPSLAADTSSPRGTLKLFLDSTDEIYELTTREESLDRFDPRLLPITQTALNCLDLSGLPEYSRDHYAGEAAICLREALDRVKLPPIETIPGPEDITAAEGGEPLTRWQIPNTEATIVRMAEGPRRGEYLFSSETVQNAADYFEKVKRQPYRTEGRPVAKGFHDYFMEIPGNPTVAVFVYWLPSWFHYRCFGLAIWQWMGLGLSVLIALGLMFLAYRIGRRRSQRFQDKSLLRYWITVLFSLVALGIPPLFKRFVFEYLSLRGLVLYVVDFLADLVFLMALIVLIISVSNRVADSIAAWRQESRSGFDATLIRIFCRVLGLMVAAVVFLEGGRYLGFPITTLLASAGIGGLAVALAAQGMLKGLFGTVTLLLDRSYRVGDRIVVNEYDGYVEEIGLRSTKIRQFLTGHVITIPNDQMADAEIENISNRKHIRRLTDLHIPIDTPREKVEQAVEIVRSVLENHEGMDPEFPPRVYFNEFNPDSFNIRLIYWLSPPDLWTFYAFSEQINLEIFRRFESRGIQFSLPVRHSFWKHDEEQGPLDIRLLDQEIPSASPEDD